MQRVYNPTTDSLRVEAQLTTNLPAAQEVIISHTDDSIRLGDGTNLITSTNISGKQGLDVNVINSVSGTGNSIMIGTEDGTVGGTQHVAKIGSDLKLEVKDVSVLTELENLNDKFVAGNNIGEVSILGTVQTNDTATQTALNNILTQLNETNGLSVGTEDGLTTGTQHVFVNNLKQMVLSAQDRVQLATYTPVGSNYRLDEFTYTSATFPGVTVKKQFTWSDFGTKNERVSNINWVII